MAKTLKTGKPGRPAKIKEESISLSVADKEYIERNRGASLESLASATDKPKQLIQIFLRDLPQTSTRNPESYIYRHDATPNKRFGTREGAVVSTEAASSAADSKTR